MMIIDKVAKPGIVLCCLLLFSCAGNIAEKTAAKATEDKLPVAAIAIPVNGGWGYEIYVDNKPFIKQETIPAAEGFQAFRTREEALKIAGLVMAKMKEGKKFPAITIEELQSANIEMNKTVAESLKQ